MLRIINYKFLVASCLLILFTSCSMQELKDANVFLHIQKGKTFNNFLKQYEVEFDEDLKEYKIASFKFNFQNKNLICNTVRIVNSMTQTTTKTGNTKTTTTTYITDNYFIITDDSKDKLVLDGFYKYEIFNGTRNDSYLGMFEQINKGYLNYIIDKKIYTLEEIKEMTEEEKLNKLSL